MENKLYRDEHHKVIGGVCAGLSNYLKVDTSLVRIVFVLALLMHGVGLVAYIILWIIAPAQPFINPFNQANVAGPTPLDPQTFMPVKKTPSSTTLIFGIVLILFGAYFLLKNYDLLPDIDIRDFLPVVIIAIGLVLIFGARKQKQFEATQQHVTEPVQPNDNPETL